MMQRPVRLASIRLTTSARYKCLELKIYEEGPRIAVDLGFTAVAMLRLGQRVALSAVMGLRVFRTLMMEIRCWTSLSGWPAIRSWVGACLGEAHAWPSQPSPVKSCEHQGSATDKLRRKTSSTWVMLPGRFGWVSVFKHSLSLGFLFVRRG